MLGAVAGALVFGRLTDRFGRKRLFTITVAVYLLATLGTGLSWNFASLLLFRFLTGAGIGGEYGAVNSAIQELIPARRRGWVDLAMNGSFWLGAALGALGSVAALDPRLVAPALGWRLAFAVGAILAVIVLYLRRFIPESPRWLMTHGRHLEADATVGAIEARIWRAGGAAPPAGAALALRLTQRASVGWGEIVGVLLRRYPERTILVASLMAAQAFCYNAVFFTYALVLTRFYAIPAGAIGWFILPFALGNFAGPLLLGPLFDHVGRKTMIALTYGLAGALLCLTGALFAASMLGAAALTGAWSVIFFFASAGASAAYLTAGEAFPLEIRAVAISLFYAFGSLLGAGGPALFGALIGSGERVRVLFGYLLAGALMIAAALVALRLGFAAERRPLEEVAPPLSLSGAEGLRSLAKSAIARPHPRKREGALQMPLNVLVTGSNSGFGLLIAEKFAKAGATVHATLRDPARGDGLQGLKMQGLPVTISTLDVTDAAAIQSAVAAASAKAPIDVLINNAGFEVSGPVEHLTDAGLSRQFQTNVLGPVRLIRAVAPAMRERGTGTIINISSVAGHIAAPFTGAYSASKHALEALSEALWFELRPFGVRVVLVEPGGFPTNFGQNVVAEPGWDETSPYRPLATRFNKAMEDFRAGPPQDPHEVADLVYEAATSTDPRLRWLAGDDARTLVPLYRSMEFENFAGVMLQRLGLADVIKVPAAAG